METEENPDLEKVKELMEDCEYEEAEKILKPLFKKDPNNVEILDYLGEIYLNIGNFKGSKKMLEKSISLKPDDNPDKYMDYAQLLDVPIQRVDSYKKAIELYVNNLKKNKGNKKGMNNNDIKESISSAYSSIVSLYMTTDLCDDPNAENICENSISEALKYCPESIEALLQLSNLRIIRKRDKEAKEAMFKILEKIKNIDNGSNIDQTLPERDILINLSQNFAELKMFKEASYVINTLIKIDDEDIESYYL
jgi:tetratricopeptide (TPR) repeat protein